MYFCISYWKRFISIAMLVEPGRVYKLIKLVLRHSCFLTHLASSQTLRFHCGCALSRTTSMMQNPSSDVCRRSGPSSSRRVVEFTSRNIWVFTLVVVRFFSERGWMNAIPSWETDDYSRWFVAWNSFVGCNCKWLNFFRDTDISECCFSIEATSLQNANIIRSTC